MGSRLVLPALRRPPARPLAVASARLPTLPSLRLPSLRLPSRREVAAVAALACALALSYALARETSLFAVRTIEIAGAGPTVRAEARAALAGLAGTSLVTVEAAELERRLREVPSVRSAYVDRAFPDTLQVVVGAERRLAVVRRGSQAWIVAESGRVISAVEPGEHPRLPRIRLTSTAALAPGKAVADPPTRLAVEVLRAVPERFPARVLLARASEREVTLVVAGWLALHLGEASALGAKLRAAAAVLRSLSADERNDLAYLDVTLPARPVAAYKPQGESEG